MNYYFNCLLLFLFSTSILVAQETVYIEAGEFGRGILKPRSGECFAISPFHVVEQSGGEDLELVGEGGVNSVAVLAKSYPGDIAILRLTGGGTQRCKDFTLPFDFDKFLKSQTEAVLELRNSDGSVEPILVRISGMDDQGITIAPSDPSVSFEKGCSGGSLFSKGSGRQYLGMLLSIDEEDNRMGFVIQSDDIDRILSEFFGTATISYEKSIESEGEEEITQAVLKERIEDARKKVNADLEWSEGVYSEIRNAHRVRVTQDLKLRFQSSKKFYARQANFLRISDNQLRSKLIGASEAFADCYSLCVKDKGSLKHDLMAKVGELNFLLLELAETL